MESLVIYLSGSIRKGVADSRQSFWSENDMNLLKSEIRTHNVTLLNPATRDDDLADFLSTFGRDAFQVFCSDVVLVDARDRRGIGVGAEMVYAKLNEIPVVAIAPPGSHYNRQDFVFMDQPLDNWIHPFIFGLSDKIVPSVASAADWIRSELLLGKVSIKGVGCFDAALKYYLETQLHRDTAMNDLLFANVKLFQKVTAKAGLSSLEKTVCANKSGTP